MNLPNEKLTVKRTDKMTANTALNKAHEALDQKRRSGEKIIRMSPFEKAKENPKSRKYAINAKCYECTCEQRNEVKHCQIEDCPLWPLWPWQ